MIAQLDLVEASQADIQDKSGESISELLESIDEQSEYLSRNEAEEFEIDTEQRYAGIGM